MTHLAKIVAASKDDGRQQHVEHDSIAEAEHLLHLFTRPDPQRCANEHARKEADDRLMNGRDALDFKVVASPEAANEERKNDKERQRRVLFLLLG